MQVAEVKRHPDSETTSLELIEVKGWQLVVRKGSLLPGDLCVYFPIDCILPQTLSDIIGVTRYLSKGRVQAAKLRGEPSYGLLWPIKDAQAHMDEWLSLRQNTAPVPNFTEEEDVASFYDIQKWEPPLELNCIDAETSHSLFYKYTDIENYRNFPDILIPGEEVVITEKIHGKNSRHAYIEGTFMAGSHGMRLRENLTNEHWYVFSENMKELLKKIGETDPAILFGELYGDGVQKGFSYGYKKGLRSHRSFDISVRNKYLDYEDYERLCKEFGIEMVPILYRGPFSMDEVMKYATAKSTVPGAGNMMEGVVIRPVKERHHQKIGRVVLKYVFDQYLNRNGEKTEFH